MNEKLNEILKGVYASLTEEQKEKVKSFKTDEELIAFASKQGIELPDELLSAVSGGVQAKLVTEGGSGEFGTQKPEDSKPSRPRWF